MYEITRSITGHVIFNPYVKTKCVLKQDGFILFEGYLRLIDVKDKEGEISYNVNLYSEVVALADVLKDKTFSELDFSELEHAYNKTSIRDSWYNTGGLPLVNPLTDPNEFAGPVGATVTQVLKYPFIDWSHQFLVGGGNSNLATDGNPELTTLEQAFRPCIQLKYLINKIFADTNQFNWTSNFFNTTIAGGGDFDFDNLFMDFNWGGDVNPNSVNETGLGWYQVNQPNHVAITAGFTPIELNFNNYDAEFGYDDATNIFTCAAGQGNSTYDFGYGCQVRCYSATTQYADLEMQWLHTEALTGNTNVIDPSGIQTMESSASTEVNIAFGVITSVTVVDPGYYPLGIPTATLQGSGTTSPTINVVMDGTGTGVLSVTVIGSGSSWSAFDTIVVFNSVDPLYTYSGNCSVLLQENDTLQLQFKSTVANSIRQNNIAVYSTLTPSTSLMGSIGMTGVTNATILNTLRGELGQWDFLKGLMTMFNLITMVDENDPNNILIEPYGDIFLQNTNSGSTGDLSLAARSIEHDWTDKIDVSQMELKPLTDLNKNTIFKFVEDDDDYAFQVYKASTSGHLYGSKEWDASSFTILEGIKEIIAEPFAATVSKPLMSQFATFVTPALYSMSDDGTSEGFDNSPRIFYNNGRISTGASYYIPEQNGLGSENQTHFLQFSHLTTIPTIANATKDFLFESQQLIDPIATFSGAPVNNLFSVYWQPYFRELYNPDTRIMTIKVNLSPADIASFKFYDTVFIKNRAFRVNKIDYKPNDLATVEFILIP